MIDIAERKIEHVSFEVGCQCVQKVAPTEFARRTRPFEPSPAGFGIGLDDVQLWKSVDGWRFRDLTEIRLAVSRLRRRCTCRGLLNLQSECGLLSLLLSDEGLLLLLQGGLVLLLLDLVGLVLLLELQRVSVGLLQSVGNSEIIGLLLSLQGLKTLLLVLVMLTVSISGLLCPRLELLVAGSLGIIVGLHELIDMSFMGRAVGGDRITVCGDESLQRLLKSGKNCSAGTGWCGAVAGGRGVVAGDLFGRDVRDDLFLVGSSGGFLSRFGRHRSDLQTMSSLSATVRDRRESGVDGGVRDSHGEYLEASKLRVNNCQRRFTNSQPVRM